MHEAKTHLSRYIANLGPEEALILCNRNKPVAEVRLLSRKIRKPRIGVAKGEFTVPKSFFAPLPPAMLKAFSGE